MTTSHWMIKGTLPCSRKLYLRRQLNAQVLRHSPPAWDRRNSLPMTPRADRRRDVKCILLKNWVLHERQVLSKLLEPLAFVAECSRDSTTL